MNSKLERLFGWFMLLGLLILPFFLLLVISIPDHIGSGKQVTFDRARASLLAALSDPSGAAIAESKQYGAFEVFACTNTVTLEGRSYALVFSTAAWYQFANQGHLAVTTNRQFVWLDYRRGAKLITDDYKVSKWRPGY